MNQTNGDESWTSVAQGCAAVAVLATYAVAIASSWRENAWAALPSMLLVLFWALLWKLLQAASKPGEDGVVFWATMGLFLTAIAGVPAGIARHSGNAAPEVLALVVSLCALICCVLLYLPLLRNLTTVLRKTLTATATVFLVVCLSLCALVVSGHAAPGPGLPARVPTNKSDVTIPESATDELDPPQSDPTPPTSEASQPITADEYCRMNVTDTVDAWVEPGFVEDTVNAITLHGASWAGCPAGQPNLVDSLIVWQLIDPDTSQPKGILMVGPECRAVVVEADLAQGLASDEALPTCATAWHSDGFRRAQSVEVNGRCTTYLGTATSGSSYEELPAEVAWLVAQIAQSMKRSPYVVARHETQFKIGFQSRDGGGVAFVDIEFNAALARAEATSGYSEGLWDSRSNCVEGQLLLGL